MAREELDKIVERIRKLLALGTSANEHESAAAVAKAQELLAEHDLTMESVGELKADARTAIRKGDAIMQTTEGKPEGWKADLFECVALTSDCYTATDVAWEQTKAGRMRRVTHHRLIGFRHDVEVAGYELAFLIGEIERLAQAYSDVLWSEIKDLRLARGITQHEAEAAYTYERNRHPLKAKLYFIRGAAEEVCMQLRHGHYTRRDAASGNPFAITLQKKPAVRDFIYMEKYGKTYAEFIEEVNQRAKSWEAMAAPSVPVKQLTDSERRHQQEIQNRKDQRSQDARERRAQRAHQATDHTALRAGRDAGQKVTVRKGINEGEPRGENHMKFVKPILTRNETNALLRRASLMEGDHLFRTLISGFNLDITHLKSAKVRLEKALADTPKTWKAKASNR